jgi:hypothetical protein
LLLPGGRGSVDFEAVTLRELGKRVTVRRVQPAAAEIEGEAISEESVGAAAEASRGLKQNE